MNSTCAWSTRCSFLKEGRREGRRRLGKFEGSGRFSTYAWSTRCSFLKEGRREGRRRLGKFEGSGGRVE